MTSYFSPFTVALEAKRHPRNHIFNEARLLLQFCVSNLLGHLLHSQTPLPLVFLPNQSDSTHLGRVQYSSIV